jgi:hypothetical protein
MMDGTEASSSNEPGIQDHWSARKVQPIIVLYVVAVFAAFVVLSIFVFRSPEAVKVLVIAAVASVAATVPGVMEKVEYRLTESGIEKRTVNTTKPREFMDVFRWDQLSHVVPMKHGFKYFKIMNETNPFRRFWKVHVSDQFSGEIHVDRKDLRRILEIVERQGIAIS